LFLLAVLSHAQKVENKVWICGIPKMPKYSAEEWKQKYEQDLLTKPKLVVIKQQNQRIFWAYNDTTKDTYQVVAVLRNDSTQHARVWVELSINSSVNQKLLIIGQENLAK